MDHSGMNFDAGQFRRNTAEPARWKDLDTAGKTSAIIALRDTGNNKHDIATALQVVPMTLHGFCFRHGITGVGAAARPAWYGLSTDEKKAKIGRLHTENLTTRQMADLLGIKLSALRHFVWEHRLAGVSDRLVVVRRDAPEIPVDDVDPINWQPVHGEPVPMGSPGCAWPIDTPDGQMCCGAERKPANGRRRSSYCEHHHSVAYRGGRQIEEKTINYLVKLDDVPVGAPVKSRSFRVASSKKAWSAGDE